MSSAEEPVLGKAYDVALMRRLWRFVRPHTRLLLLWLPFTLLALAFELAQPYLVKVAIADHIAVGKLDGLATIAIAYLTLVVLQTAVSFGEQWAIQLLGQRSMHDLRISIYDHVVSQRAGFFDRMPVGRLLTRMTNDIESVNEMFASGVITLVTDALRMVLIAAIMFSLDVKLTLLTFLTLPLLLVLVNYARAAMRRSFRAIRVRLAAMNAFAQEHLTGIKVVQIFRREDAAAREYDTINAGHRDAYQASIQADASMYALVEAIGILAVALVAWWAARHLGVDGHTVATVALVVVFLEYINKFFIPIRDLSAKYAVMQGAMAAIERITELLATNDDDDGERPGQRGPGRVSRSRIFVRQRADHSRGVDVGRARPDCRDRRRHWLGQIDADQAAHPVVRAEPGSHRDRRRRHSRHAGGGLAAPRDRGVARRGAVHGDGSIQHRARCGGVGARGQRQRVG
jgi:ATP-binding cassette, subfamily B, multidrug efflux pump